MFSARSRGARRRPSAPVATPVVRLVAAVLLAVVLASGCQVKVAVDTTVGKDGTGTVAVGVGLDEAALRRVGDLNAEVRLDDLAAAGWTVVPATKEADGLTWIRARKPFASADELNRVLAELTGPEGLFGTYRFERVETETDVTYRLTGVVDTSKGLAPFSDAEVAAKLNGDPFGGNVAAIEAAEGKPVADMVTFDVTASVAGGTAQAVHPTLRDTAATPIAVSAVETKPPPAVQSVGLVAAGIVVVALLVAGLVAVRRRFSGAPR